MGTQGAVFGTQSPYSQFGDVLNRQSRQDTSGETYQMDHDLLLVDQDRIAHAAECRLVERDGQQLGMIVEKPHGYVVYACTHAVWPLDRRVFYSLEAAEREIVLCDLSS